MIKKNKPELFVVILIISVIFGIHFWWNCFHSSYVRQDNGTVIYVKSGLSAGQIASLLKEKRLIRNKYYFTFLAKMFGIDKHLRSGEYHFTKKMNALYILDHLKKGRVYTYRIVIPEGFNINQIAEVLEKKEIVSKESFLKVCNDKDFLSRFKIEAENLEGYLFPDTYFLSKNIGPEQIATFMVERFFRMLPKDILIQAKEKNMSLHEIITLASLIEKETSDIREMPFIASVFYNRLRNNMPLQCDPTVLYALGEVNKRLTRKDLKIDSPYNTYIYPKLPPGPIASPGLEAIKAALNAYESDYFYFVSKNNGSHYFSRDLIEHNKAVSKYRVKNQIVNEVSDKKIVEKKNGGAKSVPEEMDDPSGETGEFPAEEINEIG